MRQVTAIFLALSLLLQCGARYGVLGWYRLNRSYIAANLCENRADKNSACHGKCYLRKQLARVDKDEQPARQNAAKKYSGETVLFFEQKRLSPPPLADMPEAPQRTPVLQHLRDTRTSRGVFHPPAYKV